MVSSELKQTSLAEAIVQAARPRSYISPLLLGLALDVLIQLSHLGFSSSYDEVVRYKQSAIVAEAEPCTTDSYSYPAAFTQWVGDNVDHNISTIDGYDSFHGMGIISITTGLSDIPLPAPSERIIPRLQHRPLSSEIASSVSNEITIIPFNENAKVGLSDIVMKPIIQLCEPIVLPVVSVSSIIWYLSSVCKKLEDVRPNWSGFMKSLCHAARSNPCTVQMAALIDLPSSDETCLYSTLVYICGEARRLNTIPVVTFDQSLYLKALGISKTIGAEIVCRLGGFHTVMNFLSSIGDLMAGSGLEEVLQTVYGPNTLAHILSGKAYSLQLFSLSDTANVMDVMNMV